MFSISNLFNSPSLQESESKRKAELLFMLVVGFIIVTSITEIAFIITLFHHFIRWFIIVVTFDSIGIILLYYIKKGYVRTCSVFFTFFCVIILLYMSWTAGGIKSQAVQILPIIVLLSGLLLGKKNGIMMGLIVTIILFILFLAETYSLLPSNTIKHIPLTICINLTFIVWLIVILQYLSVSTLENALRRSKEELDSRTKTEFALRKSEEFRLRIFEGSQIPIVVIDASTLSFIECNQAAIDIYCFNSRENILGKTPLDVSAPLQYDGSSSAEKIKQYIDEALSNGSAVFEWKHQRPNGDLWDAEVRLMSFQADGKQYLQFTLLDISQRKYAEIALEKSEKKVKSISANFTAGMIYQVLIFPDGKHIFTYVSESVKKYYGVTPKEVLNNSSLLYSRVHPDDYCLLLYYEAEAMKTFSPFKVEVRILNPGGEYRWSSLVSTPSKMEDGSICWDGIEFDITEQKNNEKILLESETRYRQLHESITDCLIQVTIQGDIVDGNRAFIEMLGYSRDEISSLKYQELSPSGWLEMERDIIENKIIPRGYSDIYTTEFIKKDGTIIPAELKTYLLRDEDGNPSGMWTIVRDITERIKSEQELKNRMEELEIWHKLTIGREDRILELKEEVNKLLIKNSLPPRYNI